MLCEGILNYKFLGDKHRNIGFLKCQRCKMQQLKPYDYMY